MTLTPLIDAAREAASWQIPLYEDMHAHPELSLEEHRTADAIAVKAEELGFEVQRIGGGVVGVLTNGEGPTVLLRADIDALPVTEATGLPYASQNEGVMHACGHDVHLTGLLGAAAAFASARDAWAGTLIALFQPAEENAAGAQAMIDDGLVDKIPKPDLCLSQHVLTFPAGQVRTQAGPTLSSATSVRVTVYGKGSHGSMPHLGVDPVVLASSIVLRLQTIVSRVVEPGQFAVCTVGSLQAGASANVIPASAQLLINVRAYSDEVMEQILSQIAQIVEAECQASGSPQPPQIEHYDIYPLTANDEEVTARVREAFVDHFGEAAGDLGRLTASEDFSRIPDAFGVPYCYWGFGGFDADSEMFPNHNPKFAPVQQPTLTTGTEALVVAAHAWLGKESA